MPAFIPGLELSEIFYRESVRPLLRERFPSLRHAAARIGSGSEVLGFDTQRSTDHDWGPRFELFIEEKDFPRLKPKIDTMLREELPPTLRGYSTHFGPPDKERTRLLAKGKRGHIDHRVEIHSVRSFFKGYLHADPTRKLTHTHWLTMPEQKLATVRRGEVFHDEVGLEDARERLLYYPDDVWRYLLASQWMRISQEEAFVGRCGEVGDELGSRLVAGRIVRDIMRLCFLMEREYAPYSKWFGTAFSRLESSRRLIAPLGKALDARGWKERERHLCAAYGEIVAMHNALRIAPAAPTKASRFHNRPFLVIHADGIAAGLRETIKDPALRALAPIGSVNQFSDSTDLLCMDTTILEVLYRRKGQSRRD